jgi:hypothetical protein
MPKGIRVYFGTSDPDVTRAQDYAHGIQDTDGSVHVVEILESWGSRPLPSGEIWALSTDMVEKIVGERRHQILDTVGTDPDDDLATYEVTIHQTVAYVVEVPARDTEDAITRTRNRLIAGEFLDDLAPNNEVIGETFTAKEV